MKTSPRSIAGHATPGRSGRKKGAALVLTLVVLVVTSILVTGFVLSMRTEMTASYAIENTQRTKMIAQGAVAHGLELLRSNIPDPAPIDDSHTSAKQDHWLTNPGRLTIVPNGGATPSFVDLHSGVAPLGGDRFRDENSFDLNSPLAGETTAAIVEVPGASSQPEMRAAWVPVFKDPSAPSPDAENPIIGRYAFWMDDESSKINYNVALGKPSPTEQDPHPRGVNGDGWYEQKEEGFVVPTWAFGDARTVRGYYNDVDNPIRQWSLGYPASVNLDVLFENRPSFNPKKALIRLHNHTFFHGFHRYPEAILKYVDFDGNYDFVSEDEKEWYDENKWNLTFYSRSPEFNAFGKSRFFTTHIPLSLEGGPAYQMPFATSSGVLHFNSLLGNMYMSENSADRAAQQSGNRINETQFNMLMDYFRRNDWPGYEGSSFTGKYGNLECAQMALNILHMARMATCYMANGNGSQNQTNNNPQADFSGQYAARVTSTNYFNRNKGPQTTPERYYWRINSNGEVDPGDPNSTLMLPQGMGPWITELKFTFVPRKRENGAGTRQWVYLEIQMEAEIYMQPLGARLFPNQKNNGPQNERVNSFQAAIDYIRFDSPQAGRHIVGNGTGTAPNGNPVNNFNWSNPNKERDDITDNSELNRLRARLIGNGQNARIEPNQVKVTQKRIFWLGDTPQVVGRNNRNRRVEWDLREDPIPSIDLQMALRAGLAVGRRPKQMIPMTLFNRVREEDLLTMDQDLSIDLLDTDNDSSYQVTWELQGDPRIQTDKNLWKVSVGSDVGSLGAANPGSWMADAMSSPIPGGYLSKFKTIPRTQGGLRVNNKRVKRGAEFNTQSRVASPGYVSLIPSGVQRGLPWESLNFDANGQNPPDWLLLNLMGATYPMQSNQWNIDETLPDSWSTISYMNSTAGKVNINSQIYPISPSFNPPRRKQPLLAVFKHLRGAGSGGSIRSFVDNIIMEQETSPDNYFQYVGELTRVPGYSVGNDRFEKEDILRNMAGCLTTQSNTFGLWGVAQTVKKISSNSDFARVEQGDRILGEKRFFAVIERYIWPGVDGVAGNGHTNASGRWDRLANTDPSAARGIDQSDLHTQAVFGLPGSPPLLRGREPETKELEARLTLAGANGVFAPMDGPDPVGMDSDHLNALGQVPWSRTPLEEAYNPPHPVIKYRVAYFKYLDQ